jgi:CBS domain-containing protein
MQASYEIARDVIEGRSTEGIMVDESGGALVLTAIGRRPSAVERPAGAPKRLKDVLRRPVVSVAPTLRASTLLALFEEQGLSSAPVVDALDRPLGLVTAAELAAAAGPDVEVQALMTRAPLLLDEEAGLEESLRAMRTGGVHRALVVTADGEVVGILSAPL